MYSQFLAASCNFIRYRVTCQLPDAPSNNPGIGRVSFAWPGSVSDWPTIRPVALVRVRLLPQNRANASLEIGFRYCWAFEVSEARGLGID
jgi:hypothetical protein